MYGVETLLIVSQVSRSNLGIILNSGKYPKFANIYSQIWEYVFPDLGILTFQDLIIPPTGNVKMLRVLNLNSLSLFRELPSSRNSVNERCHVGFDTSLPM